MSKRRQLTLFIEEADSQTIEEVRKQFNPQQHSLIKAHVTLCREDELENSAMVQNNLAKLQHPSICIDFGIVIRFAEGKGVLLPAKGANVAYHQLRTLILQDTAANLGLPEPHITLMHPRNSTCTDEAFEHIATIHFPEQIKFTKVSLIEQEWGKEWVVLNEFELKE